MEEFRGIGTGGQGWLNGRPKRSRMADDGIFSKKEFWAEHIPSCSISEHYTSHVFFIDRSKDWDVDDFYCRVRTWLTFVQLLFICQSRNYSHQAFKRSGHSSEPSIIDLLSDIYQLATARRRWIRRGIYSSVMDVCGHLSLTITIWNACFLRRALIYVIKVYLTRLEMAEIMGVWFHKY